MSAVPAPHPSAPPTGKRGGGGSVALSRNGRRALTVFFVVFLIFLYVPTVLLIIFSFNESTVAAFPLAGLTLDWYREAFTDPQIRTALLNSLKVASACAVLATFFGVMVSFPLARRKVWFRSGVSALLLLPLVVPTVVLGVALLILFQRGFLHVPLGLGAVLIGHVIIALPFCVLLIMPRIASIDRRLEEAAYDLGASGLHDVPAGDPAADHPGHPVGVPDRLRRVDRRGRRRELPHQRLRHVSDLPVLGPQVPREDADADPDRDGHDRALVRARVRGGGPPPRR